MKARVKATGEIVEVSSSNKLGLLTEDNRFFLIEELEEVNPDYWEKLKHQYAGMAMQGLLSNHLFFKDVDHVTNGKPEDMITTIASSLATALVKKLKSESNEN